MTDADLDKLEALAKAAPGRVWALEAGFLEINHAWPLFRLFGDCECGEGSNPICGNPGEAEAAAAFIIGAQPATILSLIASARRDAEEIERLRVAIEGEKLNYDGALSDLESALQVLARRINGEKDLDSARTWLELNYPDFAASALIARAAHTGEG